MSAFLFFWRVIYRSKDWQIRYYKLLEEQTKDKKTFGELLHLLHGVDNSVEVSFASKLIATVSPEELIWDKYVLKNLGFDKEWNKANGLCYGERIKVAVKIYEGGKDWYGGFIDSEEGKRCIEKFDEGLPEYKDRLTAVKKVDYMVWSCRGV